MMPTSGKYILSKYKLNRLKRIEDFVAECVEINVPFNNPITRFYAFTHKAGVHANAILNDPSTCEILKPEDMTDAQIEECTAKLESMADLKVMSLDESDALIRSFHLELQNENGA
ncbi:putative homocitrate synthase, mitochondrial precursor [Fusarium fujikuroi]|nr:putative homocitrate synthase, mitochondrial precursor [Fusarium fujikuroi]KLP12570.1 putative homocitrate synthase, mitochondrial precursor [Fusarium fujikuroi]